VITVGRKTKPFNNITREFMTEDLWQWLIHYTSIMLDFVICELHFQNPGMEVKSTPILSSLADTGFCNISVKTVMQTGSDLGYFQN